MKYLIVMVFCISLAGSSFSTIQANEADWSGGNSGGSTGGGSTGGSGK